MRAQPPSQKPAVTAANRKIQFLFIVSFPLRTLL